MTLYGLQALRFVSSGALRIHVARSLVGGEDVDAVTLSCELVRAALWGLTRGGPVHINRLLNVAGDLHLAMGHASGHETTGADEEHARGQLRRTLDVVAEAGDIVELDQGRWSPTRPRVVYLGAGSPERLLLGGVPSSVLPDELRKTLSHRGALRFTHSAHLERALMLRVDPLDAWIGAPSLALRDWAQALLTTSLSSYSEPADGADVQVYAPAVKKRATQMHRWADASVCADGRYLAKRRRVYGAIERRIVELGGGRIVASGNVLMPGEARRMMYAFDAFASRQVRAEVLPDGEGFRLTLWSEVPSAERRFFSLVGELSAPEDRYYPRTWRFPRSWEGEVRRRLEALEVNVQGPRGEGQS